MRTTLSTADSIDGAGCAAHHNVLQMIRSERHNVVAVLAGAAVLLWSAGAGAQDRQAPSTLLPLEELWATELEASPVTAPVYDAGQVFVALLDGRLTAVNLDDGTVVWETMRARVRQLTVGELDPSVEGLGGKLLYVANRDELQGLEKSTGRVRWSKRLDAPLSAPLVWNNGWLIAALDTQTLLGLRAETGETLWSQTMGGGIHVSPAMALDRMYVSLDTGDVVALSLMTGATMWERHLGGTPDQILPLDDLFVGATDNFFYRLSRVDGAIKWRKGTGGDIVGLPAVDERRVYFCSLDNMLYALSRSSGVEQWREPLAARPTAGPSHTGDLLMLGGRSQDIRFFDPAEGVPFGGVAAPSELFSPPLHVSASAAGPLLVTITGDGLLRALRHASGPVLLELAAAAILSKKASAVTDASVVTDATSATTPASDPEAGVAPARRPSIGGEYAIQVSAFADVASASRLADRLMAQSYAAYVIGPRQGDVPALHRVRIGDFPNRSAAEAVGRQVEEEEALDWFVVVLP